jgi:hypothetical protein
VRKKKKKEKSIWKEQRKERNKPCLEGMSKNKLFIS